MSHVFLGGFFYSYVPPAGGVTALVTRDGILGSGALHYSCARWRDRQPFRLLTAPLFPRADKEYLGRFRVRGTVAVKGTARRCRVRLFDRLHAKCLAETWSALDGSYGFDDLAERSYFALAFDSGTRPINASIADFLPLETMS
jgi:hypothetical protein